jgi:hypothetical protein
MCFPHFEHAIQKLVEIIWITALPYFIGKLVEMKLCHLLTIIVLLQFINCQLDMRLYEYCTFCLCWECRVYNQVQLLGNANRRFIGCLKIVKEIELRTWEGIWFLAAWWSWLTVAAISCWVFLNSLCYISCYLFPSPFLVSLNFVI